MPSDSGFNVRILTSEKYNELQAEMSKVGSEWAGVVKMARKARHFVVKVHNLRTPAVLILKEEMLSKGGDCAIHRDAIVHRLDRSDCILIGTQKTFHLMLKELHAQPFELPRLADEIRSALDAFGKNVPAEPKEDELSGSLCRFYSEMRKRTLIMGILNVTPDSFSDGGQHSAFDTAVEHALCMIEEGADVIDIGGESSRPNAEPVSAEDELARVIPVIEALSGRIEIPISIDTYKPEVARAALDAGASIINDITGFAVPGMSALAAERRCPSIIMHMKGTPKTMQNNPVYDDVVDEIMSYFRERISATEEAGLPKEYLIIDPGIGFAKTAEHNLEILRKLSDLKSIGLPILVGSSRKAFIGRILGGVSIEERVFGTAATVALSVAHGANIVRVHDVKEMKQVALVADAILHQGEDIEPEHIVYGKT